MKRILFLCLCMFGAAMSIPAYAANAFSIPALSPTPQFDMGSTAQSVTFTVNNSSNGGERIYIMRFRINSGSTFNAATAAPAGWTPQRIRRARPWRRALPRVAITACPTSSPPACTGRYGTRSRR